jgi:thiaminase (transcriptional activator TenA)
MGIMLLAKRMAMLALLNFAWQAAVPEPKFTQAAETRTAKLYQKTVRHPFLLGLTDGSLPKSRFQYYLIQDALYLRAFAQVLNLLAAKAPTAEMSRALNEDAIGAMVEEKRFHESVLKSYGVNELEAVARHVR